jgi:hypothetical protein
LAYQFDDEEEEEVEKEKAGRREADENGDPVEKSENLNKGDRKEE